MKRFYTAVSLKTASRFSYIRLFTLDMRPLPVLLSWVLGVSGSRKGREIPSKPASPRREEDLRPWPDDEAFAAEEGRAYVRRRLIAALPLDA